jgi:predicted nucleic acid-binding protein
MVKIIDACALMAYLEKEEGYEKVKNLFIKAAEGDSDLLMTTINLGEVLYVLLREYGQEETAKILKVIETFPIEFISVDLEITKQAAIYKAHKKMSYADCFAAALAKLKKGELVTSDKELKEVEEEIKIFWIR